MDYISNIPIRDPSVWIPAVCCLIALLAYHYYTKVHNFWSRRGVKGEKLIPVFTDIKNIFLKNRVTLSVESVRKYGKVHGTFFMGKPRLVIADPEVLRQICIKDFDVFPNHNVNEWSNQFQRSFLVWLRDDHWKRVRAMMSPQFTSSKIKRMYKLLDGCAEDLMENFREQMISARRDHQRLALVDLFATYSMYTMDGITTCCYGLKLKRERGDLDIKKASARNALVRDCNRVFGLNLARLIALMVVPKPILRAIGYTMLREDAMKPLIDRVEKLIENRHKGNSPNKYDDLLQMLIDAKLDDQMELNDLDQVENHHAGLTRESLLNDQEKLKSSVENGKSEGEAKTTGKHRALATKLNDHEIISEALFLLAAGLDTTRSSMSTISYLLAHNQDVQERLYQELKKIAIYEDTPVGTHLTFDYDSLTSCQYLDAVISESLRIFGPVIYTDRIASRDYYIEKYNIRVPKGTQLLLGLHPVQNDPDYWEEPERFNPDRFMPGQREKIVPGSYAPFSLGPRHCIGMRFSLTETKLGLAKVLMHYRFHPAPGTKYPPDPKFGISLVNVKNCKVLVNYRDEEYL